MCLIQGVTQNPLGHNFTWEIWEYWIYLSWLCLWWDFIRCLEDTRVQSSSYGTSITSGGEICTVLAKPTKQSCCGFHLSEKSYRQVTEKSVCVIECHRTTMKPSMPSGKQRFKALSANACILLIKCMWCNAGSVPVTEQDAEMGSSFFQKTSALTVNYVHVSFGGIWFIPKANRLAWGKYIEFWGFNLQ